MDSPGFEPDLPYVEAGAFAELLVQHRDNESEVLAVLEAIERSLAAGQCSENFVATGLLESIQNHSIAAGLTLDSWLPLLGPQSLLLWRAVADFWAGNITPTEFARIVHATTEP